MSSNKLKLNENKTEVIILAKKNQPSFSQLSIGNTSVSSSSNVRNLGVSLDKELNMQSQVTSVCKSAYFHLKNIARVRKYLTVAAAESLVHAFITSRIDYCNSLLCGISNLVISKLQHVQNSAARLILHVKKREHITPTLVKLHWLPVTHRITFKVLLLTFKAMNRMAPQYICDLLVPYQPSRTLRSADNHLLCVPRSRLATYGDHAFSIAAPKLWNSLPVHLRNCENLAAFKSQLKTYLFKDAYSTHLNQ